MKTSDPSRPAGVGAGPAGREPQRDRDGRRVWRIEFPPGQELLNANQRLHWSAKARITKQLRSDGYLLSKYHKVPKLDRVQVTCVYEPPLTRGVHDDHNLYPSAKALVDGALVDAEVIPSDSHKYLIGPDMRRGDPHPQGRLVLIITELPAPSR